MRSSAFVITIFAETFFISLAFHTTRLRGVKSSNSANFLKTDGANENDDDFDELYDDRIEKKFSERFKEKREPKKRGPKPSLFYDLNKWEIVNRAVIAGVFVAGMGTGVTLDSAINTNPKDLASRDAIDRNAPNPKICTSYGSSAMVLDERIFVTFNPFNVYVTQADAKPGCVLRPSNVVSQLQRERNLLTDDEVESCKNGYNTWAYVGDIENKPQLTCVFQSDDAQNEFLSNPKVGLGEDIYDTYKKTLSSSSDTSGTAETKP